MAETILFIQGELGEAASQRFDQEDRIVAETARAPAGLQDPPRADSPKIFRRAAGTAEGDDADEARGASFRRDAAKFGQELAN